MDDLERAQTRKLLAAIAERLEDNKTPYPMQDRRADAVKLQNIVTKLR